MKKNRIHNIDKTGFKAPKNYFDNLENIIISDLKLKERFTETGFKTPKEYFDTLENSIFEEVSKKEPTKVISLFTKRNIVYVSSIAAAILLLFNLNIFNTNSSDWSFDDETVENYIIDENISSYEIASLLTEDELIEDNFVQHNFNDDTIEIYILNDIDIDDLIVE